MTTHDIVLSAMFTALIVALGVMPAIPIAFVPVPITLQLLGVMLAGALLGPWRGAIAVLLLIALVMMGLPVLSGGRGGMAVLAGPTAGYLLGFVPAAFVAGWLARPFANAGTARSWRVIAGHVAACVAGGLVDHACGIAWIVAVSGLPLAKAYWGFLVFAPVDLAKAIVAGTLAAAIRRVHPVAPK